MRERLTMKGGSSPRGQRTAKFDGLQRGLTVDDIYSTLGTPDNIGSVSVSKGKVGHLFVKVRISEDVLALTYNGLGVARFTYNETRKTWLLGEAKSDRPLYWSHTDGRFVGLNDLVAVGDAGQLRELADDLLKQETIAPDLLNRIADRIHKSHLEKSDELGDSLAWLCRVIEKSGDGRYKHFLLQISEAAADRTLRKYAAKAAAALPETTARYVPNGQRADSLTPSEIKGVGVI